MLVDAVAKARIGEGRAEVRGPGEPVRRELLQRLADGGVHVGRHGLAGGGGGDRQSLDDLAQHGLGRVARIGRLAHQHLEEHAGQGVDVGRGADGLIARGLLRAHVVRRAHAQARLREPRAACAHRQGDSEVGDQRLSPAQEDVAGLDVPVDDTGVVGDLERVAHRDGDAQGFVHGKLLLPADAVGQRLALDVGHHVEEEAVGLTGVEEGKDVGVLQVRGGLDLGEEALGADDRGQFGLEDLDGDLSVVLDVLGQVHRGHAAFAELPLDPVAIGQRGFQAGGVGVAHRLVPSSSSKRRRISSAKLRTRWIRSTACTSRVLPSPKRPKRDPSGATS